MESNARLQYLDALRGFTILMVLYVHIVNYGLFDLKGGWMDCQWSPAVIGLRFRMPLFFFVSGLFAYAAYDTPTLRRRVGNRITRQLWPTIAVCLAFNGACHWHGWHYLVSNPHNDAYWFTQSLVQAFMAYALMAWTMHRCRMRKVWQTVALVCVTIALALAYHFIEKMGRIPKAHWINVFYLNRTALYSQFFFLGVLARMWWTQVHVIFRRYWIYLLVAACFAAVCWLNPQKTGLPTRLAGIITVYGFFYYSRGFWSGGSRLASLLNFLGRNTLPVYLFHYILLQPLLNHRLLTSLRPLYGKLWAEIPALCICALCLALACCLIDMALKRYAPRIHHLLFSPDRLTHYVAIRSAETGPAVLPPGAAALDGTTATRPRTSSRQWAK